MAAGCGQVPTVQVVQLFISSYRSRSPSHRPWLPKALLRLLILLSSTGEGSEPSLYDFIPTDSPTTAAPTAKGRGLVVGFASRQIATRQFRRNSPFVRSNSTQICSMQRRSGAAHPAVKTRVMGGSSRNRRGARCRTSDRKDLARLVCQGWEMQMGLNKVAQLTAHSIFQAQVEKERLCSKGFFAVPNGLMNKINLPLP